MKSINMIGYKFGMLTILSFDSSKDKGGKSRRFYLAQCDCGNKKSVLGESVRKGLCKSCGCLRKRLGENNPKWTGCGEISGNNWDYIKSRCDRTWGGARRSEVLSFEITIKDAWELFVLQNKQCALTGLPLNFGKNKTASLDRIDSAIGYVKNNIQWVHKKINLMKQSLSQEEFINFCRLVSKHVV